MQCLKVGVESLWWLGWTFLLGRNALVCPVLLVSSHNVEIHKQSRYLKEVSYLIDSKVHLWTFQHQKQQSISKSF
jgi:hypothetical protein